MSPPISTGEASIRSTDDTAASRMAQDQAGPEQALASSDASRLLTPEERAKMLSRIHSLVYWVGTMIPEHEVLGGSEIDLRQVVYDLVTKEELTPEDRRKVDELIAQLRMKARSLEAKLAKDTLVVEKARELLEEICGLLKAIDELRTAESMDLAEFRKRELMGKIDDARRWQRFVDSIKMQG